MTHSRCLASTRSTAGSTGLTASRRTPGHHGGFGLSIQVSVCMRLPPTKRVATGWRACWQLDDQAHRQRPAEDDLGQPDLLNHATPEDNPFTAWLGARLSSAGYDVWSDLLVLGGGKTFWSDINDGIRRKSAIFVPIMSPAAAKPEKRGVQNEIAIAVQVQRRELPHFILPIELEAVLEPNPELVRLNYIDFTVSWAIGLTRVFERLAKLGIPRRDGPDTLAMARWLQVQAHLSGAVLEEPSELVSNWFPITALPPVVRFVGSPVEKSIWEAELKAYRVPDRQHYRLGITFALLSEVQSGVTPCVPVTTEYEVPTALFLQERAPRNTPQVAGRDARAMAVEFLRKGWDVFASSRGLLRHEMSGKDSWFVPDGLRPDGWARFVDRDGRIRRRKLVGHGQRHRLPCDEGREDRVRHHTVADRYHGGGGPAEPGTDPAYGRHRGWLVCSRRAAGRRPSIRGVVLLGTCTGIVLCADRRSVRGHHCLPLRPGSRDIDVHRCRG